MLAPLVLFACGAEGGDPQTASPPLSPAAGPVMTAPGPGGYAASPAGAQRVTITMDQFTLAPGAEAYRCQNFQNPFGRDVAILQSQASISPGSHHLLVFSMDESANVPLGECSGLEFHPTLHVAQTPTSQTTYPPGVGASYPGSKGIRLNAHYLNTTPGALQPRVEVVLDAVDPGAVHEMAAAIILNDATISVPPGTGMAGGSLTLPPEVGNINLLRVQSHMHRHGQHFQFSVNGGAPLYETSSWDEPPVKVFLPEVILPVGATLTWSCQIVNDTSGTLTFGESAATNEMCTTTGYYHPAPNGMALVGDIVLGKVSLVQ